MARAAWSISNPTGPGTYDDDAVTRHQSRAIDRADSQRRTVQERNVQRIDSDLRQPAGLGLGAQRSLRLCRRGDPDVAPIATAVDHAHCARRADPAPGEWAAQGDALPCVKPAATAAGPASTTVPACS